MAGVGQCQRQPVADESGRAGNENGLPARQARDEAVNGPVVQPGKPPRGGEIAEPAQAGADRRRRGEDAPESIMRWGDRRRPPGPFDQHRQQQNEDRAVIQRQQSMVDAFAGRKFSAHVLFDEIHQRDDDLGGQNRDNRHRRQPVRLQPTQHQEQQRVEHVARAVEPKLVALRRTPRQPLRHLMVIEGIERAHRDLNRDQAPKQ